LSNAIALLEAQIVATLRARELVRAVAIIDRHLARVEANLLDTGLEAA